MDKELAIDHVKSIFYLLWLSAITVTYLGLKAFVFFLIKVPFRFLIERDVSWVWVGWKDYQIGDYKQFWWPVIVFHSILASLVFLIGVLVM